MFKICTQASTCVLPILISLPDHAPGITSNFSSRAFSVSAPSTWNSLPTDIRSIDTLSTFKRHLKFHLFQSAFTPQLSVLSLSTRPPSGIMPSPKQQLESVQKRAIHIIWYSTRGLSYHNALFAVNLPSLQARREELSNSFFREICNPNSCLTISSLPSATPRWPLDSEPPLLTPVQHYAPKSTVHL